MISLIERATDARQTPQWADYMTRMGWTVKNIDGNNIFIHKNTPFKSSLVKISHSDNPLPLEKIEEVIKPFNPLFLLIEPSIKGYDEKVFIKSGFQKSKLRVAFTSTLLIDIDKGEQEIFNSFSENARRNIKKAQKSNLRIENVPANSEKGYAAFEHFFKLYTHLGKLKGFYTLPHKETLSRFEAFKETSFISLAYAKDDSPIAAVWFTALNNTLVYMHTGITQEGYEKLANYLLVHEGIKYSKKYNCTVFDFESIYDERYPKENKKWLGYSEFKKRFHGEIIHYPQSWIKIYNLPYKLLYLCSSIFS